MKAMLKKTICIISGAIMLCGASAIPANAKDPTFRQGGIEVPQLSELVPVDTGKKALCYDYYLNSYSFEITLSETANIEAKTDRKLSFDRVAEYQWYRNGKPITGATKSTYPATEAGKYYCEITERDREFQAMEIATTTTAKTGRIPKVTFTTTTAARDMGTIDIGQRFAPVTTAILPGVKAVKTYKTGEATVKRVSELKIGAQSNDYQDLKYNTQLFVNPTGGSGKYYYTWTDKNGKWLGGGQKLPVAYEGTYKCEVRDSSDRKAYSREMTVDYKEMNAYFDPSYEWYGKNTLWFEKYEALDKQKSTSVCVNSGGTGKYTYCWQILTCRYSHPKWVDTGNYTSTLRIKKYDIKDRDWRFSTPIYAGCNTYRCIINSLNCDGKVIETKTLEIDVYGVFDN